ncbi:MAG: substrate-binding domain-containing protein [Candidatus Bathyarchaeia archaeon]
MPTKKRTIALILVAVTVSTLAYEEYQGFEKSAVVLATTTSTYDSGLLDYLMPRFESKHHVKVHILSAGTGQAIELAKRGGADVILVHSKQLELEFVKSTFGIHRVGVMYNNFVIIGPASDPAAINGLSNAAEAFRKIAEEGKRNRALFVSRADKSGTNMLELSIWNETGTVPSSRTHGWYLEVGGGMGATLRMANEKKAYTLTDEATWLSFKAQLPNLTVLVQGDTLLMNPYAVILVNPEKYPKRNYRGALTLAKWMISEEGQTLIANFTKENITLFTPMARNVELACALGFPEQEKELAWYDSQTP